MFRPKIFDTLKNYTKKQFVNDLMAGMIVGIVALPLAIAFEIASGVSPEKGLVTAVIAGFIISAFGGSRVQIGGPTGAFIVIVYGIVQVHGTGGAYHCHFFSRIDARCDGNCQAWLCNKVHTSPANHRVYQWYCFNHFFFASKRFFRIKHGCCTG